MIRSLALALLVVLTACGDKPAPLKALPGSLTTYGADPQPASVQGAPAVMTPPAGTWRVLAGVSGEDQTFEQYARAEDGALLRVLVFPVQAERNPGAVLPRALDQFVRSLGTEGFGQTTRAAEVVLGAPTATLAYAAMVHGRKVRGQARLLLADRSRWVLAIGHAAEGAPPGVSGAIAASVASLAPSEPVFYARSFEAARDLEEVVARVGAEAPVVLGDLMAVQLFIEAGLGVRYPLVTRDALHEALAEEARTASPDGRAAFRGYREALGASKGLSPDERAAGLTAQGRKVFQALLARVPEAHPPAVRYHGVWKRLGQRAVGSDEDGITVAAVQCLTEVSSFLASIAANREVKPDQARIDAVQQDLAARFESLAADDRASVAKVGASWAALRYAWDQATPGAQLAFRRAVLERLVPAGERVELSALADPADLMRWMHGHAEAGADGYVLAAARLPAAERDLLIDALGVPDAFEDHLGW